MTEVSRSDVERVLIALNEAENRRDPVAIDLVMASDVEGWRNGEHVPNRAAERAVEEMLFAAIPDYHRVFEQVVIEAPFAAVRWRMSGTSTAGVSLDVVGSSWLEVRSGRIARYWLFVDGSALLKALAG